MTWSNFARIIDTITPRQRELEVLFVQMGMTISQVTKGHIYTPQWFNTSSKNL